MREPRHVPQLRTSRGSIRRGCAGTGRASGAAMLTRLREWLGGRRRSSAYVPRDHRPGGSLALAGLTAGIGPRARNGLDSYDVPLALVVLALILLGTVMVYSASITLGDSPRYHVAPTHFLVRHLFALGIAAAGAAMALAVPMSRSEERRVGKG